jgi:hypothetical protein
MRKVIAATILFFCGVLAVTWLLSERAAPKMIDVDPAQVAHHR